MFAIAFDLVVKDTAARNVKGVSSAYAEIGATLAVSVSGEFKAVFTSARTRIWPI